MNSLKIFNNPSEIGVRILFLFQESKVAIDLQRIIYYDYLILHYGDIDKNYDSLHPANPFHSTEIYVKRTLIQEGLNLICKKGLVTVLLTNNGIKYQINKEGIEFLKVFECKYSDDLKMFSELVNKRFSLYSDESLKQFINSNIGKWKDEFENEVFFRSETYE